MNYLNLNLVDLMEAAFAAATQQERGVWIGLLLYCVAEENGGVIRAANDWNERKWLMACGIEWETAPEESELYWWEGDDLHVWGYPHHAQDKVNAGRVGGKKGGRPRKNPAPTENKNPPENPPENPPHNPNGMEWNEKKGNGMEEGRNISGQEATNFELKLETEEEPELPETPNLAWSPETGWVGVTADLIGDLGEAYPACHIRRQLLAMEQWLLANPAKARKSNWRRFVTNWLKAEQDRGGDLRGEPRALGNPGWGSKKIEGAGAAGSSSPAVVEPSWDWQAVHVRLYGQRASCRWSELAKSVRFELRQAHEKSEGAAAA